MSQPLNPFPTKMTSRRVRGTVPAIFFATLAICLSSAAAASAGEPIFPQVSAGLSHTCGLRATDGSLKCWGGVGFNYGEVTVPADLGAVKQVSAGVSDTCAIKSADDTLTCWGGIDLDYGQATVPPGLGAVKQVSAGIYITCAVKSADDTVACWGGRLPGAGQIDPPGGLGAVKQVSAGLLHACAIKSADDTVVCWGGGMTDTGQSTVPAGLGAVKQVSAGPFHTCAVKALDNTVVCWGAETGSSAHGQSAVPTDLGAVKQVSAGGFHTCAVKAADSAVACWGAVNTSYANADYGQTTVPAGLRQVKQVSSGFDHTCAVKANATITCWGGDVHGYGQNAVPDVEFPSLSGSVVNFGDSNGLDFGDVTAGQRSAVISIPILSKSLAPDAALTVAQVAFTTSPPFGSYSIISQNCTTATLADGDYCVVRVRFTPKIWQRDEVTASLTITDDSPAGTHTVPLTGTALAPSSFVLQNFSWVPALGGPGGNFYWEASESAKVTITLAQPVTTVVTVKKGKKKTKKSVTKVQPVPIVANRASGLPTSDGVITTLPTFVWDGKVNRKPAARGTWTVTITAVGPHGKATLSRPMTIG